MAEAVLSATLKTLGDLLVGEAKFVSGVSDQVEEIRRELVRMKCFSKDADAKQHKDERVHNWVREVKDLCYQVEDVLETFAVEVASKRSGEGIKKVLKRFAYLPSEGIALHKVGADIAKIKAQIIDLRKSLKTYGIQKLRDDGEAIEKQWRLRQTYARDQVDEPFVGMEDEISQLVSVIADENQKGHRVISIYGMGGLGKTTVARKIYNHSKVKHCFEAFAWHCISQQYDFKVVLRDILKQLVGKSKRDLSVMEERELVRELINVQTQKKCLIVLDDVWEKNDWTVLSQAFSTASSKILLTTRKKDVAEMTKRGYPHKLRSLTVKEGWQLLQEIVFLEQEENNVKRDPELESVGREIVGKCGGLPLAISVLGGILRSRNTLRDWQKVCKDVESYLSGSGSPEDVLALSYNDLPYNLKLCFLYMGIFQEDEKIEARKLYHLWIAEGMVSSKDRKKEETMMDVAERCLDELASRSMVQVKMDNLSMVRRIKSCKLHDLMRELCLKKGEEEEFLENLDKDADGGTSSFPNTNARRLAIRVGRGYFDCRILPVEQMTNQSFRALFVRYADLQGPPNFRSCRVLHFEKCQFRKLELPKEISKHLHLRYLSLFSCGLDKSISFIGDLPYLETLDLRTQLGVDLPNNIFSKMKRLRHLYFNDIYNIGSKKLQLNGLSGLETLVGFDSETCRHEDLSELVNLQHFDAKLGSDDWSLIIDHIDSWKRIKWVKVRIEESSLEQTHFKKLLLCHKLNDLVVSKTPIGKLPQYQPRFWPNLIRLRLFRTKIDADSMELLKKLPELRKLSLGSDAFIGKEFICDATDFPRLRSLKIHMHYKLEKWRIDEGALPNLSSLLIDECEKLKIIPEDGKKYLTNLKKWENREAKYHVVEGSP